MRSAPPSMNSPVMMLMLLYQSVQSGKCGVSSQADKQAAERRLTWNQPEAGEKNIPFVSAVVDSGNNRLPS